MTLSFYIYTDKSLSVTGWISVLRANFFGKNQYPTEKIWGNFFSCFAGKKFGFFLSLDGENFGSFFFGVRRKILVGTFFRYLTKKNCFFFRRLTKKKNWLFFLCPDFLWFVRIFSLSGFSRKSWIAKFAIWRWLIFAKILDCQILDCQIFTTLVIQTDPNESGDSSPGVNNYCGEPLPKL